MQTIKIKPLSINKAFQGRRFKTVDYKKYEKMLLMLLPKLKSKIPKEDKIILTVEFGFSSVASDIDNPLKPFIDALQKKYSFNDKQIYRLEVDKSIVKKGKEFIKFKIDKI